MSKLSEADLLEICDLFHTCSDKKKIVSSMTSYIPVVKQEVSMIIDFKRSKADKWMGCELLLM